LQTGIEIFVAGHKIYIEKQTKEEQTKYKKLEKSSESITEIVCTAYKQNTR